MPLSEQELREMVRNAIARTTPPAAVLPAVAAATPGSHASANPGHASHGRLALVGGGDSEGRCLIEPAVACTHCGYCQSLGH